LKYSAPLRQESVPEMAGIAQGFALQQGGNVEKTNHLLGVCSKVIEGTTDLVDFVDKNRKMARTMGIETIAIELAGIVDGGRLGDIRNVLAQSVRVGQQVAVSPDIMHRLDRAQSLLRDASTEIGKETGIKAGDVALGAEAVLGQDGGIGYFWVPFVALGVAAIGIAVYAHKKRPPAPSRTPLSKTVPKIGSRVFLGSRHRKTPDNR
jgi:hypothetical protein